MSEKIRVLCINRLVKDSVSISENIAMLYGVEIININIFNYSEHINKENRNDAIIINTNIVNREVYELVNILKSKVKSPIILYCKRNVVQGGKLIMKMDIEDCIFHDTVEEELCFRIVFNVKKKVTKCIRKIKLGDRIVNINDGVVETENEIYKLTSREVSIIQTLYANKNHVVSMDEISNVLWHKDSYGYENAIMVYIGRLRKKVEEDPANPKYITTIKGLGYSLIGSVSGVGV